MTYFYTFLFIRLKGLLVKTSITVPSILFYSYTISTFDRCLICVINATIVTIFFGAKVLYNSLCLSVRPSVSNERNGIYSAPKIDKRLKFIDNIPINMEHN